MEKISFEFLGLTLLEPLSSLMNWVLALFCGYFYLRLKQSTGKFSRYWSWFFLLFFVSFFFGGIAHLFFEYLGMNGKIPGWSAAILAVSSGEAAMIWGMQDLKKKQVLTAVMRSKLLATFVILFIDFSFTWVMLHTAGFWLMVGVIAIRRMKSGMVDYKYFLIGMSFLFVIAAVKIGQVDIDPAWFNRDDIAHFVMLGMYFMFYKGVSAIIAREQLAPIGH